MSLKTLWNFRKKVIDTERDIEIFNEGTGKLAKAFNVDTDKQRIDSVSRKLSGSNMKRLGRINIFARSIHGFLVNLRRHHWEAFDALPEGYKEKYLADKAAGCFSMVKPTESEKTLKALSADLYDLGERFKGDEKITSMPTYKILNGSDNNKEAAKAEGIEVVSPTMGQTKGEGLSISYFEKTETGAVSKCPEGHIPLKTKIKPEAGALSKSKHIAVFDLCHCPECFRDLRAEFCPAKQGKRHYYLRYDEKQLRLAERREYETTDEFKDRYRYRAGVESTMSSYDRLTGVKRLRVRGLKAVRFCATLKALGVNILRAAAFRGKEICGKEAAESGLSVVSRIVLGFYRLLKEDFRCMCRICSHHAANNEFALQMAA